MKRTKYYLITAAGLISMAVGLILLIAIENPDRFLQILPYVCIGAGCGTFGYGMGQILTMRILKKHPDMQKQMKIEENDERNMAISNRSKAKGFDLMTYVFGALLMSFLFFDVEVPAILLGVFAYLLVQGYAVYCRMKYEKEM